MGQSWDYFCRRDIHQNFQIENLYTEQYSDLPKLWNTKGLITNTKVEIFSIKWTGNVYFNHNNGENRNLIRVVIGAIEPFLIWREPNADYSCDFGYTCYPHVREDGQDLMARVDEIKVNYTVEPSERKCCDGYEVELLNRLKFKL